jgi:hypothetical protein
MSQSSALVDVTPIQRELAKGAKFLQKLSLPLEAPPAFLLDARREAGGAIGSPGRFDNRWVVLPQDFPSANLLLSRGLRTCLLIQERPGPPVTDLSHALLRWQEAGIRIHRRALLSDTKPMPLFVEKPWFFRSLFYTVLALMGLRRNSAGGFGSLIPIPSSSHSHYG